MRLFKYCNLNLAIRQTVEMLLALNFGTNDMYGSALLLAHST